MARLGCLWRLLGRLGALSAAQEAVMGPKLPARGPTKGTKDGMTSDCNLEKSWNALVPHMDRFGLPKWNYLDAHMEAEWCV